MLDEKYYKWHTELCEIVDKLRPYYDIDKVKSWAVFVYDKDDSKNNECGIGLFDILPDEIKWYVDDHTIIEDAKPIIKEIQSKLKEIL